MKLFCIVFFILTPIFLVSPIMAQNNQIGPLVGLNLASVDFESETEQRDRDTSIRIGFSFGGILYLALSSNIGLQFEPSYTQKGSKFEVKWMTYYWGEIIMEQTLKVNYIDIPILFKASFGQGSTKPYILAGANISFKTGNVVVDIDKVTIDGEEAENSQEVIRMLEDELEIATKSTDFGLNLGVGILFQIGTNQFFLEGQYNIGLKNIVDEEDEDDAEPEIKNKGIQIKVGILFPLGG